MLQCFHKNSKCTGFYKQDNCLKMRELILQGLLFFNAHKALLLGSLRSGLGPPCFQEYVDQLERDQKKALTMVGSLETKSFKVEA